MRASIGAALQEAALDAILTGREHLLLQATLQGIAKAERVAAARGELLERVGLTEAADRRVGGYSGGMKRRLDLALALVHRPRILFLDEPTTGLDLQSRSALWEEVARLAHDEGITVFLTTQYLEEADVLADRVGIIDHGKIVAEGTPAQLKAEIGSPSVEVVPADAERGRRARRAARRASATLARNGGGSVTRAAARAARRSSPSSSACSTRPTCSVASLQLHQPSLDDVFLAKTGRKLEGAGDEPADAVRRTPAASRPRGAAWALRRSRRRASLEQVGAVARRSVTRTLRQRGLLVFPLAVPADPVRDQRQRAQRRDARSPASRTSATATSRSPCRSSRARCSSRSPPAPISRATSSRASSTASR